MGNLIKILLGHLDGITSLAVLTDGNLASSSKDLTIKLWHFFQNSTYSSKYLNI
jgi:WD40 repeat protein